MHRIIKATPLEGYRLDLTFVDGTHGIADLSHLVGRGVFAAWRDLDEFRKVSIGEAGELIWPGEIDLCPDSLYLKLTGQKPEEAFPGLRAEMTHA